MRTGLWPVYVSPGVLDTKGPFKRRDDARDRVRQLRESTPVCQLTAQEEYAAAATHADAPKRSRKRRRPSVRTGKRPAKKVAKRAAVVQPTRVAAMKRNQFNTPPDSDYLGVTKVYVNRSKFGRTRPATGSSWRATIFLNRKRVELGRFFTPEEAAMAYNNAALKHRGNSRKINHFVPSQRLGHEDAPPATDVATTHEPHHNEGGRRIPGLAPVVQAPREPICKPTRPSVETDTSSSPQLRSRTAYQFKEAVEVPTNHGQRCTIILHKAPPTSTPERMRPES